MYLNYQKPILLIDEIISWFFIPLEIQAFREITIKLLLSAKINSAAKIQRICINKTQKNIENL